MSVNAPPPHGVLSVIDGSASSFPGGLVGITVRGRYRIESVVHEGVEATILRATHLASERAIALRVLAPGATDDTRREFSRVASLAADLDHAQLPRFIDRGETEDGLLFVAFELGQGASLSALETPADPTRAVRLVAQVLHGLRYLHGRELIHGSLSPQSLFVTTDDDGVETVKLVELGTAISGSEQPLTVGGLMAGTPGFLAPEQIGGSEIDHRADLYSLGVIFYELLTGLPAWGTRDPDEVLEQQLGQSLPPLPANLSSFDSLVQRLAARERTDRFGSAGAALAALEASVMGRKRPATPPASVGDSGVVAGPAPAGGGPRIPGAVWIGAAAVAVAGVLTLLALRGDDAPGDGVRRAGLGVEPPAQAGAPVSRSASAPKPEAAAAPEPGAAPVPAQEPAPTADAPDTPTSPQHAAAPSPTDTHAENRRGKKRRRQGNRPRSRTESGEGDTTEPVAETPALAPEPDAAPEPEPVPTPAPAGAPDPSPLAKPARAEERGESSPLMSPSKKRGPSADALLD